jgi:type II secretory pathway pseudopilin PulG
MRIRNLAFLVSTPLVVVTMLALAQETSPSPQAQAATPGPYTPKFPGDPARSDSESAALGYMRVVTRAQKLYNQKHNQYATSLADLVNTGSFTKRMAKTTERGDYTVGFKGKKDSYVLTLTPKNIDAEHRSFYADEDGVIHGDETKAADSSSPKVK